MNLLNFCICMYIFLKPYYISESGTLQISDLFIILAFGIILLLKTKKSIKSNSMIKIKPLIIYVCCVLIINSIYFLKYGTVDFIMSSLQYIFILIGVYVFYSILDYDNIISNVNKILKINIIIQLFICLLGFGRYFSSVRYMGTFNDPNQFAFYIFLTFMITRIIDNIEKKNNKLYFLLLLIVAFLIIKSASTGMLLGFGVYIMLNILRNIKKIFKYLKRYSKHILVISMVVSFLFIFFVVLYFVDEKLEMKVNTKKEQIENSLVVERIKKKLKGFEEDNKGMTFIEERCLDKIVLYPEYLLFGAGQGYYDRFDETKIVSNEIHSTLPSILFYYGIIPFILLIYWIWINLKNLKLNQSIPYIAILIESFTLLNQRQLLLWVMIILGNKYIKSKSMGVKEEIEDA